MKYLFGLCLMFFGTVGMQGQMVFKGIITDKEGEVLIGVNVVIVGTKLGTNSNVNGEFELESTENTDYLFVEFSYIGYEKVLFNLKSDNLNTVIMPLGLNIIECYFGPVITAKRIFWKDNTPTATDISLPQLQLDNQSIITPVLNRVPGVFMHSGALNTNRITIRGIGNRSPFATTKIKAYLDEIPLTTGAGETTIEDIDMSLIENVHVVKGPTASIYGAGLGGMIGLGTGDILNRNNYVATEMMLGSYGLRRNNVQVKLGKAAKYSLQLGFNDTHNDGYRDNNEYDRTGLTGIFSVAPTANSRLTALVNHVNLKAFIPSSLNQEDFDNEPTKAAFTWGKVKGFEDYDKTLVGLSYQWGLFENKIQNTTSLFSNSRDSYESRPFNILQEKSLALGGRTMFSTSMIEQLNLKVGGEFFHENYDWQTYETNDGTIGELLSNNREIRSYYNIFAQANWIVFDNTKVVAGINLNDTNYDLTDRFLTDGDDQSGDYSFDFIASPSLMIEQRIAGVSNTNLIVFGLVSHGFSPPTLEETLTPDGQINPDIQPEKGWNFEIGAKGNWKNLTYNISAYSMQIDDLLVARRTDFDQFVGINAGKTQHNGLEVALEHQFQRDATDFTTFVNYTFSDYTFKEFIDGEDDYSENELTGTAPHLLTAGLRVKNDLGIYGNINYQYTDAMPMRDDNSIYSESYQLLNAKIGFEKTIWEDCSFDIYAGVNNIFDAQYASMILINAGSFGGNAPRYYYPGLPRNFYGGVRLKYTF
jgi:iron complex outermembrane receptor protein